MVHTVPLCNHLTSSSILSSPPLRQSTVLAAAICQVNFHEVNSLVNGTCPDRKLSFVRLNSSVGFAAAICTESQTEDSGALTTLYMTIQPQCRRSGEQQRWSICSWQPNPTSEICSALDQQCCDRVTDTNIRNFFPANTDVALLACQVNRYTSAQGLAQSCSSALVAISSPRFGGQMLLPPPPHPPTLLLSS